MGGAEWVGQSGRSGKGRVGGECLDDGVEPLVQIAQEVPLQSPYNLSQHTFNEAGSILKNLSLPQLSLTVCHHPGPH